MNKLLLALLAMFLVLGLAYAQAEPTLCPKGDECAAWETCSSATPAVCEPTPCTAEPADVCKGGFCRVEEGTGACEEKITACPPWQKLNVEDNKCDDVDCTADGKECTTAPVVGFCDVTTLKCVEACPCKSWEQCTTTTNECGDKTCANNTDDTCGEDGFCKKAEPATDSYGVCIENVCTANANCGADGFCKKAEGATAETEGVCEAIVTCPKYQKYQASDNTCIDIACATSADCNPADKSTEGYCEGADATKEPAVKGKCVALCVQDDCAGWEKCSETTNQCEAIACTADKDCGEGAKCDDKKCVPVQVTVKLQRVGAVLSRSRADGEDAKYDALTGAFKTALDESKDCKPLNAKPVAFAKRSIGYYVESTCTDTEVKDIAAAINGSDGSDEEEEKSDAQKFVALDDSKPVTAELELTTVSEEIPDTCIKPEFKCGTTQCNYPCQEGTECTKDNEDLVCGDYQKCDIENDKGTCNSAAIYSTLVAIVLAVAAIVF